MSEWKDPQKEWPYDNYKNYVLYFDNGQRNDREDDFPHYGMILDRWTGTEWEDGGSIQCMLCEDIHHKEDVWRWTYGPAFPEE